MSKQEGSVCFICICITSNNQAGTFTNAHNGRLIIVRITGNKTCGCHSCPIKQIHRFLTNREYLRFNCSGYVCDTCPLEYSIPLHFQLRGSICTDMVNIQGILTCIIEQQRSPVPQMHLCQVHIIRQGKRVCIALEYDTIPLQIILSRVVRISFPGRVRIQLNLGSATPYQVIIVLAADILHLTAGQELETGIVGTSRIYTDITGRPSPEDSTLRRGIKHGIDISLFHFTQHQSGIIAKRNRGAGGNIQMRVCQIHPSQIQNTVYSGGSQCSGTGTAQCQSAAGSHVDASEIQRSIRTEAKCTAIHRYRWKGSITIQDKLLRIRAAFLHAHHKASCISSHMSSVRISPG